MSILKDISVTLQSGDANKVKELVEQALNENIEAVTILNDGLLAGMSELGDRWKRNEVFVPQVLIGARAMGVGTDVLEQALSQAGIEPKGRVLIGTVKGDLHDIGKNLVAMMVKGAGYELIDIGVDVPAEKYVEEAEKHQVDIVMMSALLTTTMPYIKTVVDEFEARGVRDKYILMAGGAPVTADFVTKSGGDYYTSDAITAAEKISELLPG